MKKVNKGLLLGFIAPYLLIVVIIFAAQYISNSVVMNALKENVVDIVHNSFSGNVSVIEQNLAKVKETAAIVAQNTAFNLEKVNRNDINSFYSQLTNARDELSTYCIGSGVVNDICIQNDKEDYLVSFSVAYNERIKFYETMVTSKEKTPEELLKASESAYGFSTENICFYNGGRKVIPFVYPTPILKARTGSVLVYVDEKALFVPLQELLTKSGGFLSVTDENGQSVWSEGKDVPGFSDVQPSDTKLMKRLNGENYYLFGSEGDRTGWKYSVCLPEKYVLSSLRYYQVFSLIFNFIILILGFAVCLFFTIKKSKAYQSLAEELGIKPDNLKLKGFVSKDEYAGLKMHISKIKDENVILLEKGAQSVLTKLIHGRFEKHEDMHSELQRHNIMFDTNNCGVIAVKYDLNSLSAITVENFNTFFANRISEVLPGVKLCFAEKDYTAVLFECEDIDFKSTASEIMCRLENDVFKRYGINAVFGSGSFVSDISKIAVSYKEAKDVVEYNLLNDDRNMHFYEELPADDDYYYPIEIENALFKSVLESDFETARGVLKQIHEENFVRRNLCLNSANELLAELRASLKKICRMKSEYLEFSPEKCSVNHFFENAINFVYMICSDTETENGNENKSRGQKICKEIKNYIELHYSDKLLSLDSIAEEFRVHPNYLSSLFKKHTGINLISFLEQVRIEKAQELLACGKYTVNEVAVSVGFASDSTFRRRFKKIKGVPPSNFIKN